jgi:RNA polymerase sigma-70 factor, ECF subfamily
MPVGRGRMMATIVPFPRTQPAQPMAEASTRTASPAPAAAGETQWRGLMRRAQDGDREAYHALLHAITPYLRAIARRHLGHGEDAEDAVQDILLVVHDIRHTYEPARPFKPWLATIARRRCIDLLRRRARRLRHEGDDGLSAVEPESTGPGPFEALSAAQAGAHLQRAVDGLPGRQREAVRLLRLQGLSLEEAAGRTARSAGALKVACHRALESLRHALAPPGHDHD